MQHVANTAQAQAWNGYEGDHWARNQARWDAVNEGFNRQILAAAALTEHDRILDVGCGSGCTTRLAAQQASSGEALGLDLSAPMLARARESARREGVGNVSFEQADAQVHAFAPDAYDVAISRFGVMFFADPVAAFVNIARALRPGGRLAFVCAGEAGANEWLQVLGELRDILPIGDFGAPGGPGMFSLADPDGTRALLSAAGFANVEVASAEVYGIWGRDAEDATGFLLGSGPARHLLGQVDDDTQEHARQKLTGILRAHESDGAVRLRTGAWLVTANRPS
ncbi:class I SAM-dependent methyltransferase [Streptomyces violascens]|uniref:class I SAM-dependent methyltransferase n=1 Tax=Streptomyces violascens TaxID=67381 RepID=UPI0036A75C08